MATKPSTPHRRKPSSKQSEDGQTFLRDEVGKIRHEIGIVESLAFAATEIAGQARSDENTRRRLFDLITQIASTAHDALATVKALDEKLTAD